MKRLPIAGLLFLCTLSLFSQDVRDDLSAPFASHLSACPNRQEVVLSWRDSPDSSDFVYRILRHTEAISTENVGGIDTIAVVASGVETYTDRPEEGVDYWYAVVAVGPDGPVSLAIPWRNALGTPVRIESGAADIEAAVRPTSLEAAVSGPSIRLDFRTDGSQGEIVIFRSPGPFGESASIDHSVVVGRSVSESGSLTDTPLPGIRWYYGIVDSRLFDTANSHWMEAAAFAGPVIVETGVAAAESGTAMRPAPLPVLRISRSMNDGSPLPGIDGILPDRRPLGTDAIRALASILGPMQGRLWTPPEPEILDVEKGYTGDRRQDILNGIVAGSFAKEDWAVAEAELFALSASNGMDAPMKARIMFYLGQCRYFQNEPNAAFLSFLASSEHYYPEARKWMIRIYDDLTPVG